MSKDALRAKIDSGSFRIRPNDPTTVIQILDNPDHPEYDDRVLSAPDPDMVWSLRTHGMLEAARGYKKIDVASDGRDIVVLTLGRRRWIAMQELWRQLKEEGVPEGDWPPFRLSVTKYTKDYGKLEHAIIENIHRDDLTPIQKATRLQNYLNLVGDDPENRERAMKLFRLKSSVAMDNLLSLLEATPAVQQAVAEGKLSATLAMHVSKADPEKQDAFVESYKDAPRPPSVSAGREKIADLQGKSAPPSMPSRRDLEKEIDRAKARLEKLTGQLASCDGTREHRKESLEQTLTEQQGYVRGLEWVANGGKGRSE